MYIGTKLPCFHGLLTAIVATALFSISLNWPPREALPKINQSFNHPPAAKSEILRRYGELPLSFEANEGQTDPQVQFLSRGAGYTLFLNRDQAVLSSTHASSSPRNLIAEKRAANFSRTSIQRLHPAPEAALSP
jgi:hypothetical protein